MLIFLSGFAPSLLLALQASRLCARKQTFLLNILAVLFLVSEIWKQLLLTLTNGGSYLWWYFPFQLCSMPLYLLPLRQLLVLRLQRSRNQQDGQTVAARSHAVCAGMVSVLTDFLADFGLLAGSFAFADQTGMRYALPALSVHSYLWHFAMIFLGFFLIFSRKHSGIPLRFLRAAILFLLLSGIAELLNLLLHKKGSIDMFYISPWKPATQVILRDIAARIGRWPEILLYLCLILAGAGLIHSFSCAVSVKNKRRMPQKNPETANPDSRRIS